MYVDKKMLSLEIRSGQIEKECTKCEIPTCLIIRVKIIDKFAVVLYLPTIGNVLSLVFWVALKDLLAEYLRIAHDVFEVLSTMYLGIFCQHLMKF